MRMRQKKIAVIIGIELAIALIFFIGADWAGQDVRQLFHSYFADIALPFGFYFLLILNEDDFPFFQPWYRKSLAVFSFVSLSEILQYFGIYALATVFDPIDFVMYAIGVLLAAFVDKKVIPESVLHSS